MRWAVCGNRRSRWVGSLENNSACRCPCATGRPDLLQFVKRRAIGATPRRSTPSAVVNKKLPLAPVPAARSGPPSALVTLSRGAIAMRSKKAAAAASLDGGSAHSGAPAPMPPPSGKPQLAGSKAEAAATTASAGGSAAGRPAATTSTAGTTGVLQSPVRGQVALKGETGNSKKRKLATLAAVAAAGDLKRKGASWVC